MSNSELVAHIKEHLHNGGKGGYYGTVIDVAVGTETINVPEKSHYETKTVGRKCSCGKTEYY